MDSSTDSRRITFEQATAAAARRTVVAALAVGAVSVAGEGALVVLALTSEGLPTGALVLGLGACLLVPVALALLYRGYRLTKLAALATASSLRRSEERYRGLYHNSPIMLHSIDRQGRLVQVNDHWLATLGYERHQVLGRPITDFLTEESRRFATEVALPRFFAAGTCSDVPYQIQKRDGSLLDVLLSATAERDEGGQISRSLAILVDVTGQKRAEADRESVIRQLEQRNAELRRFTYTVSHDLKSPLVTIKGFLGYMKRDLEALRTDRVVADLERISEAAERMRQLLDDLLELSRVGRIVHPPENVALYDLAREAVEQVAGALAERGVAVEVAPTLPDVRCDRVRMLQVLQNLLENAVKFMGEQRQPQIRIGCRFDGTRTVCFVADNGAGIAGQDQDKIFELFNKLDPGKEGTGIGLALVRRIIEVHGGQVWVESDGPGTGSTFCFTLPVAEGAEGSGILSLKDLGEPGLG